MVVAPTRYGIKDVDVVYRTFSSTAAKVLEANNSQGRTGHWWVAKADMIPG
jgi:hypothetical protein